MSAKFVPSRPHRWHRLNRWRFLLFKYAPFRRSLQRYADYWEKRSNLSIWLIIEQIAFQRKINFVDQERY